MASILKVDDLRGNTAAGDITITSEGGAATMQLQQGLSKMWFHIVVSDTSIPDSFNVSSASDNGTGSFTQNNTNNMSNDDYAFSAMTGRKDNGAAESVSVSSRKTLTDSTRTHSFDHNGNANDSFALFGQVHGDLA
tara:strand:+ start:315 stop:722 length:408 start_codon:yes stop_codon:yes gene_type:complete